MNGWYRDMTETDQDNCGKKLICELRAKSARGRLTEEEQIIADNFGSGKTVDVSDITVEFDLASQVGKFMGKSRCEELYNRCEVSTEDMVQMIKTEYDNLQLLRNDLDADDITIDEEIKEETEDLKIEMKKISEENDEDKDGWVWT